MNREPVESSDLSSVGYDLSTKTLEIEFNSGGVYQYFDVPEDIYEDLMKAPSHGKFLARRVKNRFIPQRISPSTN